MVPKKIFARSAGICRMLAVTVVLAVAPSAMPAQEKAVAEKATADHVTLLISGDLSRMREGKSLTHPEGGLGDESHGVLGTVNKLDPKHQSLRLLAGNNLGRAVKAGALSQAITSIPEGTINSTVMLLPNAPAPPADELSEFVKSIADSFRIQFILRGLSFDSCQHVFDRAKEEARKQTDNRRRQQTIFAAAEACKTQLYVWDLKEEFDAVAVGPGDFNNTSDLLIEKGRDRIPLVSQLRHAPFLAANLFVSSESAKKVNLDPKDPKMLVEGEEIFPGGSLKFRGKLRSGHPIESIIVRPATASRSLLPWHDEDPIIRLVFQSERASTDRGQDSGHARGAEGQIGKAAEMSYEYCENGKVRSFRFSTKNVKVTGDVVEVVPPVPLWPGTLYEIGSNSGSSTVPACPHKLELEKILSFSTYETFTVTDRKAPELATLSLPELARQPVLTRSEGEESIKAVDWFDGMPILCQTSGTIRAIAKLCVLAVMDEAKMVEIEKGLPENHTPGSQSYSVVRHLQSQPMNDAIKYWLSVLKWDLEKRTRKHIESDPSSIWNDNSSSKLAGLKNEMEGLCRNSPSNDESVSKELAAWGGWMESKPSCRLQAAPIAPTNLEIDSVQRFYQALDPGPALILLAQTDPVGVEKLTETFKEFQVVVGEAGGGLQPPASAIDPKNAIRVFPGVFGTSVEELNLDLESHSPWRIKTMSYTHRPSAHGLQTKLLKAPAGGGTAACCGSIAHALMKAALSQEDAGAPKLPNQGLLGKDDSHFIKFVLEAMREEQHAEVAAIRGDIVDPESLALLRALAWLESKKPTTSTRVTLNLAEASLSDLGAVPGIGPSLARTIRARGIRSRDDLKRVLSDEELDLAKWFVRGPAETDTGMPLVEDLEFVEVILQRSLFVNYLTAKRIVTADQAKGFFGPSGSGEKLNNIGVATDHELLVFHEELLLSGSQPVSVTLVGPTVEKGGELEKVTNANKILAEGGSKPADVYDLVREHILNTKPADKTIEDAIGRYDRRPYPQFSLTGVGFTFSDVENSSNFKTITNEPATTGTQSQRTIGLKPQAVIGIYSPRIEWENSFTVDFSTNRIGPNASPNALSDLWKPRSEIDGYWAKRRRINFPLYFAVQLESQFRAPFGVINLVDLTKSTPIKVVNQSAPLVFSQPKRRAFSGELGGKIANRDKTIWFRIGWERVANRSRLTNIVLAESGFTVSGTPGTIATNVNAVNLAQFLAGNSPPFTPGSTSGTLTISPATVNGIAFGYQISHDFHPSKKDPTKKISFTSKSNEWDWYRHYATDTSAQPRFRLWVVNSVSVPVIGNLSLKPAFEFFVYRTQPDASSGMSQTLTSWRPSMTLEYSFDWKPKFIKLGDSLKFNNASSKTAQ